MASTPDSNPQAITTASPAALRNTLLQTANAVIDGYNSWSIESIMAYRAPSCTHHILPSTLNRQPLNNEQYMAYFEPIMPAFQGFHVVVYDTVVDEVARKVVMHAYSQATTGIGPYANEYVIILHMTENGEQVVKLLEFVNSAYSIEYMPRLRKYLEEKRQGSAEGKAMLS